MTSSRSLAAAPVSQRAQRGSWLKALTKPRPGSKSRNPRVRAGAALEGLVAVAGKGWRKADPAQVRLMEEAAGYGADYVFFRAASATQPAEAEALVYVDDGHSDDDFAELHRRLWSWGGVPLVYRKLGGRVDLLRCAHGPDFIGPDGQVRYAAFRTLDLLAEIDQQIKQTTELGWWDESMLRQGSLWDDPATCKQLLSAEQAAQRVLVQAIAELDRDLDKARVLPLRLRRRLLVLSLLIAYLESREVLAREDFARCKPGAKAFFDVLGDGPALVKLLGDLEVRFNGDVFSLSPVDQTNVLTSNQLERFARLVKGHTERSGQMTLWRLYSFRDLPVEMISHVYQCFVKDDPGAVYTPPFLVRLMIDEVLSPERLDRMAKQGEVIVDPSCGSGVFLVEAYKRLITHWRSRNKWARPDIATLRRLMRQVRGVDVNQDAIELTAFSLCLALCEALDAPTIKAAKKLFPKLRGSSPEALAKLVHLPPDALTSRLESSPDALTELLEGAPEALTKLRESSLHEWCFFSAKAAGLLGDDVGVVLGNPPFGSNLRTLGARASYAAYCERYGNMALPDKQIAYLFLHESVDLLQPSGVLCLLQQYNLLYNQNAVAFRHRLFAEWDVREALDFVSIRGLFGKGDADTKVLALVVEKQPPPPDRLVLHATFRRTGRVAAQRGFDLDYYDQHWLPRGRILDDPTVWRSDLLGGGRVIDFVARLRQMRTLGAYAEERGWTPGEGFIAGSGQIGDYPEHIIGKRSLPSDALVEGGIDASQVVVMERRRIERPRTEERFTAPMLLVREHLDLYSDVVPRGYLTYPAQIVGFCAPKADIAQLREVKAWLDAELRPLRAYTAATSSMVHKATAVAKADIEALPYPPSRTLAISPNEAIVVEDIVDHYRDFVRIGQKSSMAARCAPGDLDRFCEVYTRQVNLFYPGLRALGPAFWPGTICQPFVFGEGRVDWSGVDALRDRLERLLTERHESLRVHRIARLFDGSFIFLLKPARLRYWLRSVALRDADETLVELRAQGL